MNTNNGLLGYGYTSDDEFVANLKKNMLYTITTVAKKIYKKGFGRNILYKLLQDLGYLEGKRITKEQFVQ